MNARPRHRTTRPRRTLRAAVVVGLAAMVASGTCRSAGPPPTWHRLRSWTPPARPPGRSRTPTGIAPPKPRSSAEDPPPSGTEPVDLTGLTLQELQARAAQMQAEFIEASVAYESAALEAKAAEEAATTAEVDAAAAVTEADAAGDVMGQQIEELYSDGIAANPLLSIITTSPDRTLDDMYVDAMTSDQILSSQSMTVETLDAERHRAEVLSAEATSLRLTANEAAAETKVLLEDIQVRAAKVASTANATLAAAAKKGRFADPEQATRNKAALAAWQRYLTTLDKAHVVPPPAEYLNRTDLPYRLSPLKADRQPVAGVASVKFRGRTVPVLPAETVAAVSGAFAQLGKPYVMGNAGPETFDCSGLARAVWRTQGYRLGAEPAAQYEQVRLVPIGSAQVGDLVFFADPAAGVEHVGLNLGNGLMLAADATSSQVGVQEYPGTPYAVGRVTLPRKGTHAAPPTAGDTVMRCGNEEVPASAAGMDFPMEEGTYTFTSKFGDVGGHWESGFHTGLDFAAPMRTPVRAAKTGTVTVAKSGWGGPNLVTIDHGDGLTTLYAHMGYTHLLTGDRVSAGQIIGTVGEEGNATGPHLHFEVRLAGHPMDPMMFLAGGGAGATALGRLRQRHDPPVRPVRTAERLGAPAALRRRPRVRRDGGHLRQAERRTAVHHRLVPELRAAGQDLRQEAGARRDPGTSNHGWGLAVDLCGGIQSFTSPQHDWMSKYAGRFGWRSPHGRQQGGSKPEPWHWEFGRISRARRPACSVREPLPESGRPHRPPAQGQAYGVLGADHAHPVLGAGDRGENSSRVSSRDSSPGISTVISLAWLPWALWIVIACRVSTLPSLLGARSIRPRLPSMTTRSDPSGRRTVTPTSPL